MQAAASAWMAFFMSRKVEMEWERRWLDGVRAVRGAFDLLGAEELERLRRMACSMRALKKAMQELAATADAEQHCASCGGACCVSGKYHFTGVDLLVYLAAEKSLFAPRFDNGLCPYLGDAACLIEPGYRPFNCITFICDMIEDRLAPEAVSRFYEMERELRECYREMRSVFPPGGAAGPLL